MTAAIYFDANAVIRLPEHRDEKLIRLLERMEGVGASICTSEMTLSEALVVPLREGDTVLIEGYEGLLRNDDGIFVLPMSRDVLRLSAELRAFHGGKAPDAIHVATALLGGCKLILSSDRRLRLPERLRRIDIQDLDELVDLP